MNRLLELSRCEYVTFLFDDDVMLPKNLEMKTRVLDRHSSVGLVHSRIIQVDKEGNIFNKNRTFGDDSPIFDYVKNGKQICLELLEGPDFIAAPSVMVRKECYDQLGGFDARLEFSCVFEMWMRICLFYDCAYIAEPLIKYRWHDSNESLRFDELRGIREDHAAKRAIIDRYPERIPGIKNMKKSIEGQFGGRAIDLAYFYYYQKNFNRAMQSLKLALNMQPTLLWNRRTIGLIVRLLNLSADKLLSILKA